MEWSDSEAPEDLHQRSDTDLLRLVQERRHRGAVEVLLLRPARAICGRVGRLARHSRLHWPEVDDAAQEVLIAVYLSLGDVDLTRLDGAQPCRLRSFLAGVVLASFLKFRRHRGREQRHDGLARARALQGAASAAEGTPHWLAPGASWRDEPSLAAQEQEALADLEARAHHLPADEQQLWRALRAREDAGVVAARLGCTADTVRRRWEKLIRKLRAQLAERH